ncbi:hypothetical protein EUGRSUZ_F00551 [Eucalyptus grandis]|uniref:Uncharacterized protein n=2 Tax=Eucalyptus grandis TaxID=71139 RepID=A0ACC3KCJ3_EUCGR|nr:hypothetical protein EUGRSUZ_F00551 [Eucalyptus grandis]
MDPCIMSSSLAPNNFSPTHIPPCGTGLIEPLSLPELDMNEGAPMMSHPKPSNNFEENRALKRKLELLYNEEASIRDELEFAASPSLKKLRMEVTNWLEDVEKLKNDFHSIEAASEINQEVDILMQEAEDLRRRCKGLFEVRETKVWKLLEDKIVGEAFWKNAEKVLENLVGNQISRLGIYGMGGVGKTALMVHVHNELLEKANYGDVLWITVSQDFNLQRLQDSIWKELGLGILQETDVRKRALMLFDCLAGRGKSTIILDDLWEHINLVEVGIPVRADGIKLVLTTRSYDVCRRMNCQEVIKMEPLSHQEALSLFLEEFGSKVALNLETEAVVKSIVKECAGLPLALITMARSMQGVTDVFEWKDSLVKLIESDMGQMDMEKRVLMKLAFSYDHLGSYDFQQCFLSCALYPKDELIDKFELIEFFIDQGLIGTLNTREKQYDRGLVILQKLENLCLLEDHGRKIKMHNLIRDMALYIMGAISIVKAGKWLRSIPPEEYWTDALEKVSLIKNDIREFPLNMSPNCPRLSTLLLNRSLSKDVVIPDSFFQQLKGLKVLNLSGCKLRELPNSISELVNLRALLLRKCWKLRHTPNLGKLSSLRKLDICGCDRLQALEGLEMLVNLRYLDLTKTRIKRLAKGTLWGLLNLQYLKVQAANVEDITKLWALEALECYFNDVDDFNMFVRVIKQRNSRFYELNVNKEESMFYVKVSSDARFGNCGRTVLIHEWSDAIVSMGGESTDICLLIPQDVQTLVWVNYDSTTNLSGMGHFDNLESLNIQVWKNLRVLCGGHDEERINFHDSSPPTPTPLLFQSLRFLEIAQCPKLKYLFGHGSRFFFPNLREIKLSACEEMVGIMAAVITSPPPGLPAAFPILNKIKVVRCGKMKRLVESEWLPHVPNLKSITVRCCENMEEIIEGPPSKPVIEISLKSLKVYRCNKMRRLFSHEWLIHLRNLETIHVSSCRGMVEMISGVGHGQEGIIISPVNNSPSPFQSSNSFPNLKLLWLHDLAQLKSICGVSMSRDSVKDIHVYKCRELNRIPF